LRHDLQRFKSDCRHWKRRRPEKAVIPTEAQVAALEKKQQDDETAGEVETAYRGYLGSQDALYIGTLKGGIYQQTFVDTSWKVAFAKLYSTKTPIISAGLLHVGY
jgi:hypothetical protein